MPRMVLWLLKKLNLYRTNTHLAELETPPTAEHKRPRSNPIFPAKRRRKLTIPGFTLEVILARDSPFQDFADSGNLLQLPASKSVYQRTISQIESRFFNSLPYEIRQQIYHYLFADHTILLCLDRLAERDGQPGVWRWSHSIRYSNGGSLPPLQMSSAIPARKLSIAWLFSCRQA